jgi:hypothetical protein
VHFHILGLDGVYARQYPDPLCSELTFHSLPTPTREETENIARRIADRVDAILRKRGRSLDPDEADAEPTEIQLEPIQFLPPPRLARRRGPGTGASLLKWGCLLRCCSTRSRRERRSGRAAAAPPDAH